MIELRNLSKQYTARPVVRNVSLEIAAGETFALIGPSGCGKTTTLKAINRLVEPTSGSVWIEGRDAASLDVAELRRGIGYVIQDVGLFAHYTVRRNVALVPELLGWRAARVRSRVDELLEMVGMPPAEFGERYPRELSGGQRQRAGIARALAADPPLVLLDEPFSALDPITREHLQDEFAALSRRLRKTFVIVTHDVFEAVRLAHRVAVMRDGVVVQCATPRALVERPADEFVTRLLGRHRYQLRLMTAPASEAAARATGATPPTEARVADVPAEASVWRALEAMDAHGAKWVRAGGEGARAVSREGLLAAVES